jgi:HD-like signal output (HDOD) protein/CheY-like chemotaxis protein
MATKSILLAVAEPQALVDINQVLGAEWEATLVASQEEALVQLEKRTFDALLVDFNLGSPDGSELMNQALEKRPEVTRFLLAYESDLALVAAKVLGTHHLLPKPVEPASLKSRIENGVAPEDSKRQQSGSDSAAGAGASPPVPAIFSEVLEALESPGVTNRQVGEIIARDAVLTAEVLRLTNAVYLGTPRNITDPVEAVGVLGLETVKALVMSLRFLAEHSQLKPGYLSLDQIWRHSTNVAQIARDLVLFETKDRALASEAFVAGLVHDLGKVVLATNFDDLYGRVHSLARKQPVPLWDIEKEMFGANHGEIGGCLVGMWNLPSSIVDATALHHEPPLGENDRLTPLAAVHIANVLEHELGTSDEFRVAPIIDTRFLNEMGLLQRLPVWRAAFANGSPPDTEVDSESGETIQPGSSTGTEYHVAEPVTATRTATSGWPRHRERTTVPAYGDRQRHWVYAGVAVALLLLLALWLGTQPELSQSMPIYARTPSEVPAVATWTPSPETAPPAATSPQNTTEAAVADETPATTAPTAPPAAATASEAAVPNETPAKTAPTLPTVAPEPTSAVAPQPATNAAPLPKPAVQKPKPDFHLNGIIYTVARPSAIVNGQTVYVGDRVDDATVVAITPAHVTLQLNGQRKTYALH